jgi:hypothetical protein
MRRTRTRSSRPRRRPTSLVGTSVSPPTEPPSLERSLASTARGLETLLRSLDDGGFRDAIGPYQDMRMVLVQQRLWSRSNARDDLDPDWARIARTARGITAILTEFGTVMAGIGELDRIEPNDTVEPAASTPTDDRPELELMERLLGGASASALAIERELGWLPEQRRDRVARLVDAGVVERRGWGRSLSYRLTASTRRRLAARLAEPASSRPERPPLGSS